MDGTFVIIDTYLNIFFFFLLLPTASYIVVQMVASISSPISSKHWSRYLTTGSMIKMK